MMGLKKILLFIFLMDSLNLYCQTILDINYFFGKINQTTAYKIAENNYRIQKIQNDFFHKSLYPSVTLNTSIPYQRSISEVTQPDGTLKFIERNYINSNATLNTSQVLPFTGGTINLSNSINYSRDFNNNYTNFSSNWVSLSFWQPINGYNSYKWDRKLNNLIKKKDSIDFLKNTIKIRYDIAKSYIEAQNAQLKCLLLNENIKKVKTLLNEISEKYLHGRAIKTDIAQVEISIKKLNGYLKANSVDYKNTLNELERVSGIEIKDSINLVGVDEIEYLIDKDDLVRNLDRNSFELEWMINDLKAESNLDKTKKEGGISLNLQGGLGVNSSSTEISRLFNAPLQTQFLTIGINIPILDWGVSKDKIRIALLEKENVRLKKEEDRDEHLKSIDELISYFWNLKSQMQVFKDQIKLSEKLIIDYRELLLLGKLTISEFNNQLYENINLSIEYEKLKSSLYLLKYRIDELNLKY
ncbi:TolC family protein [Flavobacterium sp. B17]|uniref:TolC family protein n=1 Tax=Flavobacterium sp. B17 TaxID=95618 RepID=UPI00034809DF|nr:TolC family protein [Flavobacterium sp. B17]